MTGWIALSDHAAAQLPKTLPHHPAHGVLVFDITLPLTKPTLLLDHSGPAGRLSLRYDPSTGFTLTQQQAAARAEYILPANGTGGTGTGQLHFGWNVASGDWTMRFVTLSPEDCAATAGCGSLPLPQRLLDDLCRSAPDQRRSPALLWCGATTGHIPEPGQWIGPRTPIDTLFGPMAAGSLRTGDMVLTRDHGPLPIRAMPHQALPGRGSFAPLRLRAPFFSSRTDLLVSACQQVVTRGIEVEYLFGEDAVLVAARHLVDGSRALVEEHPTLLPWVAIDLDHGALILSGGCALATATDGPTALRRIDRFEASTLQALRRRGQTRTAA